MTPEGFRNKNKKIDVDTCTTDGCVTCVFIGVRILNMTSRSFSPCPSALTFLAWQMKNFARSLNNFKFNFELSKLTAINSIFFYFTAFVLNLTPSLIDVAGDTVSTKTLDMDDIICA